MILQSFPTRLTDTLIELPASKSDINRAMMLEAYAGKNGIVNSDRLAGDSLLMRQVLADIKAGTRSLNIRDAGTVGRFILPLLCMQSGEWLVNGEGRMLHRPYAELINALRQLGGSLTCLDQEGYLPLKIMGTGLKGGRVAVDGADSSQFISSLMLAGPFLPDGIHLSISGDTVSASYIRLTAKVLEAFGAKVQMTDKVILVKEGLMDAKVEHYQVEADWSSATYWLAALSLMPMGSRFHFPGLNESSEQGDRLFTGILSRFGLSYRFENQGLTAMVNQQVQLPCLELNMSSMPDAVPTLAVLCALKGVPARFIGINHLRHKESNRLEALSTELAKINTSFFKSAEGWDLRPKPLPKTPESPIEVYHDHRMAMAFALLSLVYDEVIMNAKPDVTGKSYPGFFGQWQNAGLANIIT